MLEPICWILLLGFGGGQLARLLNIPALVGMVIVGMILGPQATQVIDPAVLALGADFQKIAVMVILMKAGLGLDWEKLSQQGTVALRLGFFPAACEALVIAVAAMVLFQFDWATGLLLGCVIGAESPAVIVPGMLRLKSLGWGVSKGIPDAVLTGSALSDVLILLVFGLLINVVGEGAAQAWYWLPLQVLMQISLGLLCGWVLAQVLVWVLVRQSWTQTLTQDTLVTAGLALALILLADQLPLFSGYLAVMGTGFFLIELDAPLARRLRSGFDSLWTVAELFLFVFLGASIQLNVLGDTWGLGLGILAIGTLVGRMIGWLLSTWGSNWNWKERLFLLPANSAKATVQAAIGGLPLAMGIPGGDKILAVAALSILVTAPLGAWAIPTFAPQLLSRGEVDPTKTAMTRQLTILAAVDTDAQAPTILKKAAELARRSDAEVIVLHVIQTPETKPLETLHTQCQSLLADIRHRIMTVEGTVPAEILRISQEFQASEIIIGRHGQTGWPSKLIGSVSQAILESSSTPVLIVSETA
ncbi:cation:proton antiporter [Thermosynechococcaceae cyanobacterium BACA0444]|uniref:Cation:proton antiporter n=1 Tax=Pseudocalidococcus azoricus BACA0444 TaxID=2918990 RepID=A0AAE4FQ91_9CYAN|nr:cation:proton antiporter [Pseudocalidococcus azoricus]MDS3860223.1 cation:proton antiporter [Pseudocalidococcus azoricus BACA0444]